VPDGLSRARHTHGQGQQGKGGQVVGEVVADRPVAVDAGIVVQIPWLGDADGGMQQDMHLLLLGRVQDDLPVQPVHGVAGMKGENPPPAHLIEQAAHLFRRIPQGFEFIMNR